MNLDMHKKCELILRELENEGKLKVWWDFKFPEKEPLKLRLKDMLEDEVDEKYYLSDKQIQNFKINANGNCNPSGKGMNGQVCCDDISPTLTTSKGEGLKISETNVIGNLEMDKWQDHMKRIYDVNSYAPTLGTMQGGNTEPKILEDFYKNRPVREYEEVAPTLRSERIGLKVVEPQDSILVKNATKKGYDEVIDDDSVNLSYPESTTRRGRVGHGTVTATVVGEKEYERTPLKFLNRNQKNIVGDYAFCVDSCNTGGVKEIEGNNLRIRKLTPKECWRLMGFNDEDFEKAKTALNEKFYKGKDKSSSQLYKQAGNSICVPVLEKIFKQLF